MGRIGNDWAPVALLLIAALLAAGCGRVGLGGSRTRDIDELVAILRDPLSAEFPAAVNELAEMGPAASVASVDLAKALSYPRRDSYLAGVALVRIGPAAGEAIPILVATLEDEREEVRRFAAASLGSIGASASCAVPALADHLWDSEPWVRTAAAGAIEAISGWDLLPPTYELRVTHPGSVAADEPEGSLTSAAREWWTSTGKLLAWPTLSECGSP